jgi:hypothetical protein
MREGSFVSPRIRRGNEFKETGGLKELVGERRKHRANKQVTAHLLWLHLRLAFNTSIDGMMAPCCGYRQGYKQRGRFYCEALLKHK